MGQNLSQFAILCNRLKNLKPYMHFFKEIRIIVKGINIVNVNYHQITVCTFQSLFFSVHFPLLSAILQIPNTMSTFNIPRICRFVLLTKVDSPWASFFFSNFFVCLSMSAFSLMYFSVLYTSSQVRPSPRRAVQMDITRIKMASAHILNSFIF